MGFLDFGNKPKEDQVVSGQKRILIVDDDQYILDFYRELLQDEGYDVITAQRGQESIDITLVKNPHLILLDIMMPEMDGMTVFKILKEKGVKAPVIFLTNAGDTTNLLHAARESAAGFFIKSDTQPENLLKRIRDIINGNTEKISDLV